MLLLFAVGMAVYVALLLVQPRWLRESPAVETGADRALGRFFLRGWALLVAVFSPLLQAGVLGHARALFVRLPHLLVLLLWHFFALRCFGIQVPFLTAMLFLPVVFAVASLPISVQGLGTSQLAAVFFFKGFSPRGEEAVLAYSLSMTAISTASSLLLGFVFLRRGAGLGLSMSAPADG